MFGIKREAILRRESHGKRTPHANSELTQAGARRKKNGVKVSLIQESVKKLRGGQAG